MGPPKNYWAQKSVLKTILLGPKISSYNNCTATLTAQVKQLNKVELNKKFTSPDSNFP